MEEQKITNRSCNLENLLDLANESQNNGNMGPCGSISEEMNEYPQNSFFKDNISNLDVSGPNDRDMLMNIQKEQNADQINHENSKSSPESSDSDHSDEEDVQTENQVEGSKKNINLAIRNSKTMVESQKSQTSNVDQIEREELCNRANAYKSTIIF